MDQWEGVNAFDIRTKDRGSEGEGSGRVGDLEIFERVWGLMMALGSSIGVDRRYFGER